MPLLQLSLPQNATSGGDPQTQLELWLKEHLSLEGPVSQLHLPQFKIGTLESLVQLSEELHKTDGQLDGALSKVADIIGVLHEGSKAQQAFSKKINDRSEVDYVRDFRWNSNKYKTEGVPLAQLSNSITGEALSLDQDVRTLFQNYQTAKSTLASVDRKQSGNLSIKSLHDVVAADDFVLDSEHLQTVLVAVPNSQTKEFVASYESLTKMVVPRSAHVIAKDDEYTLFGVTLFKKFVAEFVHKCRDAKYTVRDFEYSPQRVQEERQEQQQASEQERQLWGEVVRLARTAYADLFKAIVHLRVIRIFVESVLRYGLPPNFLTATFEPANLKKAKEALVEKFGYLGGNAFAKDKTGKIKSDQGLGEFGGLADQDYEPFVIYELKLY
ncbi:V-type proton ATPase subunit C [Yarrowia sp. C11]|nr:V-type proton ATPase subunit C [Yarrowia sp. E02]KAG5369802.1 V-type proton ATPase subunit C [Yarrowia sp. C11]